MDTIDDAIATAEAEWRAYGVHRSDAATLAADLRSELESAAADGITPAQLLGGDVRGLARRLADEAGVRRTPRAYGRVLRTALVGALLGAALGYLVLLAVYPAMVRLVDLPRDVEVPILLAVLLYYGGAAAVVVVVGAVAAVRVHLRDLPGARSTGNAMSLLLPLAGVVVTPITIGFARSTGYSDSGPVVLAEVALVVAAVTGAVVLARRWALRDRDPRAITGTAEPGSPRAVA
ncbi:hypothetical protein AB0J86_12350 [Micromonospora sp. NPDC049559]|uniref:hypothetical protein n=1 Tax=Micromonospora sp. NPDC049559 TaxID=3155923 RepID=UPI0034193514